MTVPDTCIGGSPFPEDFTPMVQGPKQMPRGEVLWGEGQAAAGPQESPEKVLAS